MVPSDEAVRSGGEPKKRFRICFGHALAEEESRGQIGRSMAAEGDCVGDAQALILVVV